MSVKRTVSLRAPYSGYYFDQTAQDDSELTRVGPGTPAGELFRRYWNPVCMTSQIEADVPLVLRILGEDLVAFRDKSGRYALLHKHCSHRGTSLEFGIIADQGIRCCYHGWHFDVDGTILDTPGEPETSRIKDKLCHGAYPVKAFKGLLFAYMGPKEEEPPFPYFDSFEVEGDEMVPYSLHSPCNWLQISENGMDPFHSVFLHARLTGPQFPSLKGFTELPICKWYERDEGFFYTNARRAGDNVWVRMHDHLLPNIGQNGSLYELAEQPRYFGRPALTRWVVPLDDTNSRMIAWRHYNDRDDPRGEGKPEEVGFESVDFYGQTAHRSDEEKRSNPGDWDAWVTQGPITAHNREHLGQTDRGVMLLRRHLREAIRRVQNGERVKPLVGKDGGPLPTHGGDTIVRVPKTNQDDREVVAAVAGKVAETYQASVTYVGGDRREFLERELSKLNRD